MIKKYNFDEFVIVSKNDWKNKLKQDLGEDVAQKISSWDCERNLRLAAYYDPSDLSQVIVPAATGQSDWAYLQKLHPDSNNDQVLEALMNGADGLVLNDATIDQLDQVLDQVSPEYCTLGLSNDSKSYETFMKWWVQKHPANSAGKVLLFNEVSHPSSIIDQANLSRLVGNFSVGQDFDHRTIHVDCGWIQRNGGSATLELAYMLSQSVHQINYLLDEGIALKDLEKRMFISTSIGSSYFLELTKLRVMRLLMNQLWRHYGVENPTVVIHGETSPLTKSQIDANTNFLRCTSESMSAVLGGVDYLSINPNHELDSADRIARNISNLMKEESYLSKVQDPSAGSYYIERLTTDLAKEAWTQFQQLEARGGFSVAAQNGYFEKEAKEDFDYRMNGVKSGKKKLVGVNDFGNQDESLSVDNLAQEHLSLSAPFEEVRKSVESFVKSKGEQFRPTAYLLGIGINSKMINARYTFATNFFNWAGFKVEKYDSSKSSSDLHIWVCCGADEDYTQTNLDKALNDAKPASPVIAAGRGDDQSSKQISEWINVKSNRLTLVVDLLSKLGITSNPSLS